MTKVDQQALLRVAKEALEWFTNQAAGNALNPPHRDVDLARDLLRVIRRIEAEEALDALYADLKKQGAA